MVHYAAAYMFFMHTHIHIHIRIHVRVRVRVRVRDFVFVCCVVRYSYANRSLYLGVGATDKQNHLTAGSARTFSQESWS